MGSQSGWDRLVLVSQNGVSRIVRRVPNAPTLALRLDQSSLRSNLIVLNVP